MAGPMNPYDAVPPEQRGMSGTTKVLLAFGIGCGVLVLLCCGVFGIGGFWVANYAKQSFSDDPAKAREITQDIVKIDIPESLEPQGSVDFRVPIRGDRLMTWAIYGSKEGDNHLILGEFGPTLANSGDFETQLRQSMRETGKGDDEELNILESETYDATIHGEEAAFRISKAEGNESKKAFWQVTGQFRGDAGPAMLIMRLEADKFSKEQVIDVIKSMED
ncbi:MAG: hypothetical protein WD845_01340 [Pirellulales bacterium]